MSFTASCMGERDLARFITERIACGREGLELLGAGADLFIPTAEQGLAFFCRTVGFKVVVDQLDVFEARCVFGNCRVAI